MLKRLSLGAGALALIAALAIPSAGAAPVVTVSAQLKGNAEVPGPGDPNGKGEIFATVKKKKRKICFNLSWKKIDGPLAAHIHKGGPDDQGRVKVVLFEDETPLPSPAAVDGCVKGKKRIVRRIARKPQKFYVNVHNAEYPDGAIRGQLERAL